MKLLEGKKAAEQIYKELEPKFRNLKKIPKLVVILVGEDAASVVYIKRKEKAASRLGIDFELIKLVSTTIQAELEQLISRLNKDDKIDGIVVQKPLPTQIDSEKIDLLVKPNKDIDGLNPVSRFITATARGIMELLDHYNIEIGGKRAVVIGASKLVGKPTGLEFQKRGASVTFCDDKTPNLASKTKKADILVVAVGKPKLITADMVKRGEVVVDVGINRINNSKNPKSLMKGHTPKLVGDVDFEAVSKIASYITPVPGGVGPMTVVSIMQNLFDASTKFS